MKRFAFYGRVSTEDQQDPTSSKNWQLARSQQIIDQVGGEIVSEFFDIGQSRSLPWKRRPEATRLLSTFSNPSRGFDAVVIGEPQRAFYGNQFGLTFPVFVHYGVGLWVPEVGGAIDPGSDAHDLVMSLYGGMSKGERNRIKTRVRSAMAAQAAIEGRYLGGRPPYGYRLGDAGAHPNPGKAAIGQRLHVLEPDPDAAPVVERIYTEFAGGLGFHLIAEGLNLDDIPSPSAHDPARNRHRASGRGRWAKSAVRAILLNPRYTGHEVWNKQRKDEVLLDVEDVALGHETKMRWNPASEWIWSNEPTHPPLVPRELFDAAQAMFTRTKVAATRQPAPGRSYVLAGLMCCDVCGRRMQGQWNHGRAYYRCRYRDDYPVGEAEHPKSVYVKEDLVIPHLDEWIGTLFEPDEIDRTCATLSAAGTPGEGQQERLDQLKAEIAECDRKLARYQAVLDGDGDIVTVTKWIAETERRKNTAHAQLRSQRSDGELSADQIKQLVADLCDIVGVLRQAAPQQKAEIYRELGVSLRYDHTANSVTLHAQPRGVTVRVGGAKGTTTTWQAMEADLHLPGLAR